jgi:hypothetical protein
MWIINSHALTEEKEDEIKDNFYQTLEAIFYSLPHNDIKVLMEDFSAKTGKEEAHGGIIGQICLHEEYSNSVLRLIDFANYKSMIISSACFPHKYIH